MIEMEAEAARDAATEQTQHNRIQVPAKGDDRLLSTAGHKGF